MSVCARVCGGGEGVTSVSSFLISKASLPLLTALVISSNTVDTITVGTQRRHAASYQKRTGGKPKRKESTHKGVN